MPPERLTFIVRNRQRQNVAVLCRVSISSVHYFVPDYTARTKQKRVGVALSCVSIALFPERREKPTESLPRVAHGKIGWKAEGGRSG